ncbi:hypothetical protein [Lysobacter gummosus]
MPGEESAGGAFRASGSRGRDCPRSGPSGKPALCPSPRCARPDLFSTTHPRPTTGDSAMFRKFSLCLSIGLVVLLTGCDPPPALDGVTKAPVHIDLKADTPAVPGETQA